MMRASSAGFTLVELLIAMAVGSLLLGALGWTIASLGRELQASQRGASVKQVEAITPALVTLLESAMLPDSKDIEFDVEPHRLEAVVAPLAILGSVGPVHLTLTARRVEQGMALFAKMEPVLRGRSLPKAAQQDVQLASGFRNIRFEADEDDDANSGTLPSLVKINFTDAHDQETTIAAIPRINSSTACRFDPISMACRP